MKGEKMGIKEIRCYLVVVAKRKIYPKKKEREDQNWKQWPVFSPLRAHAPIIMDKGKIMIWGQEESTYRLTDQQHPPETKLVLLNTSIISSNNRFVGIPGRDDVALGLQIFGNWFHNQECGRDLWQVRCAAVANAINKFKAKLVSTAFASLLTRNSFFSSNKYWLDFFLNRWLFIC